MRQTEYEVVSELPKPSAELPEERLHLATRESIAPSGENGSVTVSKDANPGVRAADKRFKSIGTASRDKRHDLASTGLKGSDRGALKVHRGPPQTENA
jgi:hypothetical protein